MNVLIFTEGGAKSGYGHISRSMAIAHAFGEFRIFPKVVIAGLGPDEYAPTGVDFLCFDWLSDMSRTSGLVKKSDIVIIDSYLATPDTYLALSVNSRLAVYLDDWSRISYPPGVVVNGSIFAEDIVYPPGKGVEYLLGCKYFPLRKELWGGGKRKSWDRFGTALITFGGADSENLTPKVLGIIAKKYPDLKKKVVIGKWFSNKNEIERCGDVNTEYLMSPDGGGMLRAMSDSDMAVSSGGQTLYELAMSGVPTVAVADAENQANNIRGWSKSGVIYSAGSFFDPNVWDSLEAGLKLYENPIERARRGRLGISFVDGSGPRRIVSRLLSKLGVASSA